MATTEPVHDWQSDYDIFDPGYVRDPVPRWDELRGCPIAHTERWGGSWLPTRYEDIHAIAHDVEHVSSTQITVVPRVVVPGTEHVHAPPIDSDPPEHGWSRRLLLSTTEEATPINGVVRFRDFRNSNTNGTLAIWSYGGSPARQNDLHWSGSAWVTCPVGFQSTSTARNAQSVNTSDYCAGANIGVSKRTSVDIGGQSMPMVMMMVKAYPYTSSGPYGQSYASWGPDMPLPEMITTLAPFTFPPGSTLYYQGAMDLSNAPGYEAIEANKLNVAAADVAAGGDSRLDPTIACLVSTAPGTPASTLDEVIARSPGRACVHAPGPLAGTAFPSGDRNEGWGGTTMNLGTIGNAPLGTTATATDYYTTNTLIRVSFAGGASKAVTFYECKQRAVNGSARNCDVVGTGNYTITQMGDARVMRFGSIPGFHTFLGSDRVLIERDGAVFVGSQGKAVARKQIRMNLKAANAIFEAFTTLGYVGLTQITP